MQCSGWIVSPHKNVVHPTLNPWKIITGSKIDYNKHCTLHLSAYIEVHEPHNNSLMPRTAGAIGLPPMGNAQGSYYFLNWSSETDGRYYLCQQRWSPPPPYINLLQHVKVQGYGFTDKDGNLIDNTDDLDVEIRNQRIGSCTRYTTKLLRNRWTRHTTK